MKNQITYMKHTVIPHGCHIYAKAYDMEKAKICAYPRSDHALPHCKFVLQCLANCPCINLSDHETDSQYSDTIPSIWFHIYHIIARCNDHVIIPLKDKKIFCKCKKESPTDKSTETYTRKELFMMETTIYDFHTSSYIPSIKSWTFTYHMCAYLVQITVVSCDAHPSNVANYFKMFYVVVIMLIGYLQVFLIK